METQLLTIELKSKTKRKEKDHVSHTKTEETHYADDKYQEFWHPQATQPRKYSIPIIGWTVKGNIQSI